MLIILCKIYAQYIKQRLHNTMHSIMQTIFQYYANKINQTPYYLLDVDYAKLLVITMSVGARCKYV